LDKEYNRVKHEWDEVAQRVEWMKQKL
jgi:hypothetical protein